jgi:hypothetical protein
MSAPSNSGSACFQDYAKPGDQFTITLDEASKKLRSLRVSSYLDSPEDTVRVDVTFARLADGANYVEQTVLESKSKQIEIRTTNCGHRNSGMERKTNE